MSALLHDVSDTARWVAYFRALESERPDALFHDPHARALAGERGRQIADALPSGPLRWSLAIRTRVFDELILHAISERGVRTVINLAAGLDARPYRLSLPASLKWIEVDLTNIIDLKEQALAQSTPICPVERLPLDLANAPARRALFARLSSEPEPVLIVTEGLLAYLDEPTVAALAQDLARSFPTSLWLLENMSPAVLARLKRNWDSTLRPAGAAMRFAPAEGLRFFGPYGWTTVETRSLLDEAQRLGREMPAIALIRKVAKFFPPLRAAYARRQAKLRDAVEYALLERRDSASPRPT